jgi:molybdopterin synthase sulfur carrier subunit
VKVRLRYFAQLADEVGRTAEEASLPASVQTVAQLVTWLSRREEVEFRQAFAKPELIEATVNRQFVSLDNPIREGDEVALLRPSAKEPE